MYLQQVAIGRDQQTGREGEGGRGRGRGDSCKDSVYMMYNVYAIESNSYRDSINKGRVQF